MTIEPKSRATINSERMSSIDRATRSGEPGHVLVPGSHCGEGHQVEGEEAREQQEERETPHSPAQQLGFNSCEIDGHFLFRSTGFEGPQHFARNVEHEGRQQQHQG